MGKCCNIVRVCTAASVPKMGELNSSTFIWNVPNGFVLIRRCDIYFTVDGAGSTAGG
jgi:hypothetical protein